MSIELQYTGGTAAVAPTRFALGQIASHYKIPMAYVAEFAQERAALAVGRLGVTSDHRCHCLTMLTSAS